MDSDYGHYQPSCDSHFKHYQARTPPSLPQKPRLLTYGSSLTRDHYKTPKTSISDYSIGLGQPEHGQPLHYGETTLFNRQPDTQVDYRGSAFQPVYRRLSLSLGVGGPPSGLGAKWAEDGYHAGDHMASSMIVHKQACSRKRDLGNGHSLVDGKGTLTRKAQKIAQRAQKLTIASISSELSSSASALYSLFNPSLNPDGLSVGAGNTAPSDTFYGAHDQFLTVREASHRQFSLNTPQMNMTKSTIQFSLEGLS